MSNVDVEFIKSVSYTLCVSGFPFHPILLPRPLLIEPRLEKTCFRICENKGANQIRGYLAADQHLSTSLIRNLKQDQKTNGSVNAHLISWHRISIYYSKKVLHHLNFTTFLRNVLYKYTKNIFLNIRLPWRVRLMSDTPINSCGKFLLKSVKMHIYGNTKFLGLKKVLQFFHWVQNSFLLKIGTLEIVKNRFSQKRK